MGSGGSKKLPKEDMDFLMENTNFTKQQIKAWYSGFMVSLISFIVLNFCRPKQGVRVAVVMATWLSVCLSR